MSEREPSVELTRRAFACADSGDFDAMMEFIDSDAVWDVSPWGLGIHTGLTGIRVFFERWIGSFERWAVALEEIEDLGDGAVLVSFNQTGWPAGRGAPLRLRHASVLVWSGGRVVRSRHYRDTDEARAAERPAAGH